MLNKIEKFYIQIPKSLLLQYYLILAEVEMKLN